MVTPCLNAAGSGIASCCKELGRQPPGLSHCICLPILCCICLCRARGCILTCNTLQGDATPSEGLAHTSRRVTGGDLRWATYTSDLKDLHVSSWGGSIHTQCRCQLWSLQWNSDKHFRSTAHKVCEQLKQAEAQQRDINKWHHQGDRKLSYLEMQAHDATQQRKSSTHSRQAPAMPPSLHTLSKYFKILPPALYILTGTQTEHPTDAKSRPVCTAAHKTPRPPIKHT